MHFYDFCVGSGDAVVLQSAAMSKLDAVVKLCSPISSNLSSSSSTNYQAVPKLFHEAKDKHIFRCTLALVTVLV